MFSMCFQIVTVVVTQLGNFKAQKKRVHVYNNIKLLLCDAFGI